MNARRQSTRRNAIAEWMDDLIPPPIQRAVISAVMLMVMAKLGLTVDQNGQVAQKAVASIEEIQSAMSNELARSFEARRKTWTLSNDLQRIEGKIDTIIERTARP